MQQLDTLNALLSDGYTIRAHCGVCQHSAALDLDALAGRLGGDFVAIGDPNPLAARLRCEKCGKKAISLIVAPPTVPTPGLGLYGKR